MERGGAEMLYFVESLDPRYLGLVEQLEGFENATGDIPQSLQG